MDSHNRRTAKPGPLTSRFDAHEVKPRRLARKRRARRLDKTDVVDSVAIAGALLAEPTLGPVQTLEAYDRFVAKIEAMLEHRRMLVEVRTLALHHIQYHFAKLPIEIRDRFSARGGDGTATDP